MSVNSIKKINGEKESGLFLLLYKILYAKFLSKETRSNKSNINIFSSNFSVIVDPSLVCWWHCISSRSAKHRVHLHKLHCRCTFQSRISCFCTTMQMFPYEFYTYLHTSHSDWLSENVSVCVQKSAHLTSINIFYQLEQIVAVISIQYVRDCSIAVANLNSYE